MTLYGNLLNRFIREKSVGDAPRRNSMSGAELRNKVSKQDMKNGREAGTCRMQGGMLRN